MTGPADNPLILVIEDDRLFAGYLKDMLEARHYAVATAFDGQEGIALARTLAPALVLTDILMPDVDGIECIRRIRELAAPPPIIAISGGGRADAEVYLKLATQLGAHLALRKPLQDDELCAAIDQLLRAA